MLLNGSKDDISGRMLGAINGMVLDMLAAIARKDYEDRRRRQAEGPAKAQAAGKYQGRAENPERNAMIGRMLERGMSWSDIRQASGCSRATVAKIAARMRATAG
jgi:DNA invertase Pin-like site-specific DNA recombinase